MGLQVFLSRRPIWVFWRPKSPNWTSWEKTRRLDSRRVWAAYVWLKRCMIAFICLNSPDLSDLLLVFWLRGWGFKFSQDVQFLFFETQNYQFGRLEKKPAGSIPGGSGQRVFEGKTWKNMFRIVLDPFVYPCFWDNRYDPRPRNNFVFQRPRLISIWKYEIRPNDLRIIIIYPDIYVYMSCSLAALA